MEGWAGESWIQNLYYRKIFKNLKALLCERLCLAKWKDNEKILTKGTSEKGSKIHRERPQLSDNKKYTENAYNSAIQFQDRHTHLIQNTWHLRMPRTYGWGHLVDASQAILFCITKYHRLNNLKKKNIKLCSLPQHILTGTIRRLAWLPCKHGMQICGAFRVFKWQKKNPENYCSQL